MRTTAALLAALALAACATPETPEQASARMQAESDSARTAISALAASYGQHMTAGHYDSIAAMFMTTGIAMAPNERAHVSRDSIRAWLTASPMPPGATLEIRTADVMANGPLAVERGTYTFTVAAQGRTPAVTATGKYLNHWHKMDGAWLIAAQIWSDDTPAAPMPAAPPRRRTN